MHSKTGSLLRRPQSQVKVARAGRLRACVRDRRARAWRTNAGFRSALHHGGALTSTSEMAARPGTIDDEAQVPSYTLPPLLDDETTSTEDWCEPGHPACHVPPLAVSRRNGGWVRPACTCRPRRRAQLMGLFRTHVYGTAPEDSYSATSCATSHELLSSEVALGGLAIRREIMLRLSGPSGEQKAWVVLLYLPVGVTSSAPIPCFLGLNFSGNHTVHPDPGITESVVVESNFAGKERGAATERWQVEKIVSRGMALATVYSGDVEPDDPETAFSNGVHRLFAGYNPEDWGTVAAVSCC
jgi:hypothetical protein